MFVTLVLFRPGNLENNFCMREVDYDEYVQLYSSASEHQRVIRVVIFRVIKASFYVRIVQKYTIYCSRADVAQISKFACADLMT